MAIGRRAAITAGAAFALAGAAPAPARRVVSLNPCLDAMLLAVADPDQIAALSHFSRDPQASSVGAGALGFAVTYGSAEEVIARSPDLVLGNSVAAPATRRALQRLGVRMLLFRTPDAIAESLEQMQRIAVAVGHGARGAARVAAIRAAIAAAAPPPGSRRIRALVFQHGGFTTGPGTLLDELLTATGFHNVAVDYGLTRTSNVPLERVLADPPEVLLQGEPSPGAPGWAERVMHHPALDRVRGRMRMERFPARLMYCGGPNLAQSAALLAAAWRRAEAAA